jgi:dsDNA-specific endonuclease/ATPase MutS2
VVTQLDCVNAKSVFAEAFDCVVPSISTGLHETRLEPALVPASGGTSAASKQSVDTLELIDARHPLLEASFARVR